MLRAAQSPKNTRSYTYIHTHTLTGSFCDLLWPSVCKKVKNRKKKREKRHQAATKLEKCVRLFFGRGWAT